MHDLFDRFGNSISGIDSFKTVNGMEACTTATMKDASDANTLSSFKTVNGMEACTTSRIN